LLEPSTWNEVRQAGLRAELDACYAKRYGLTRDELRYILDPKDVYGPDFPGETFRVLKEKEERLYGEYGTRRLVLAAWDALEAGSRQRGAWERGGARGEGWKQKAVGARSRQAAESDGRRRSSRREAILI